MIDDTDIENVKYKLMEPDEYLSSSASRVLQSAKNWMYIKWWWDLDRWTRCRFNVDFFHHEAMDNIHLIHKAYDKSH